MGVGHSWHDDPPGVQEIGTGRYGIFTLAFDEQESAVHEGGDD